MSTLIDKDLVDKDLAADTVLEITRVIAAPPEQVFDAWLQKSWGEWAGPPGVKGEVLQLEPKVGGKYKMVMHRPDGGTLTVGGTYKEITRPSRLVMSWKWEHEETDTLITLSFRSKGQGTEIHMRHEGFANADRRDSHNNGWTGTFDRLEKFIAR
ncbi:MAG TPA: SRPBCC domain-containing protein [Rhizomicrobium sp.]|jgi:glutathione S-transferase|nr:SRPBCC domain-containing protein [Rhizomicrobium sp.]